MTAALPSTPTGTPPALAPAPVPFPARRRRRRVLLGAGAALVALLGGYTAWSNTHPVRLTASIEIEASSDEVWQVLTDLSAYPQWNPFITSTQVTSEGGRLEEGATLRNVMHDRTGDTVFSPELLTVDPGRELRWIGKMGPGWIADGEHRFVIEEAGGGRVRLTQSESFTGVAVPFAEGMLRADTLPQFRAMNEALARRVEAVARE
ncbi:SRPBCC domain-containing protein [Streptomyces poriferorum]|uniref:SRPBCC domain-containing protein n=1 Tax=Streptomyces poriferorum TaxID=2798799 RepID=UPI00273F7096|nr:SRPBCC domain-containing protein [Streptomyces sp. Alt1]WLQ49024.1 SRPBCC domain-containing protein [Streptomyces sp. Alt1]